MKSDVKSPERIALILGGVSAENQVSFDSGDSVLGALENLGYLVTPFVYEGNIEETVDAVKRFPLIFNALHGGDGENGAIQKALEQAGVRFTGSGSQASRLAMDKNAAKKLALENRVPTPEWITLDQWAPRDPVISNWRANTPLMSFLDNHALPVVIKPNSEGSTVGVTIVRNEMEIGPALALAREFNSSIMIEDYIPGRELTAAILGDRALPIIEIVPQHDVFDYECKYTAGLSDYIVPAELERYQTAQIKELALRMYRSLGGRHYSRVDFRLDPNGFFFFLELNTLPGMTAQSLVPKSAQAAGLSFEDLVERIVELAMGTP